MQSGGRTTGTRLSCRDEKESQNGFELLKSSVGPLYPIKSENRPEFSKDANFQESRPKGRNLQNGQV